MASCQLYLMNPRLRLAFILFFAGVAWWVAHRARLAFASESVGGIEAVGYLFAVVILCVIFGVVFVVWVLPFLGEFVGNFFFSPNVELERSFQDKAREALERGDQEKALDLFYKALEVEPGDIFATSEIARLLCTHRQAPQEAREFLEEAMRRDWTRDDLAFLLLRLADVCAHHAGDPTRARELWQGVIIAYPGTNYADQAQEELTALDHPPTPDEKPQTGGSERVN